MKGSLKIRPEAQQVAPPAEVSRLAAIAKASPWVSPARLGGRVYSLRAGACLGIDCFTSTLLAGLLAPI